MKKVLSTLALLSFALSAHAGVSELTTLKVADGTVARCQNLADQVRHNIGAYRYNALSASLDGSSLKIESKIEFLQCQENNGKFGFVKVPMNGDIEYSINNKNVRVETTQSQVRMIRDGVYKIVSENKLGDRTQLVSQVDLSKALNQAEAGALSNGEPVKLSLDLFLLKNQTFFVDGVEKFKDQSSFGKFRVNVLISGDKAQIIN